MKFQTGICRSVVLILVWPVAAFAAPHGSKKDKTKAPAMQMVDSGAFGIFVKGQRVATETFTIQQHQAGSVVKAQFKQTSGPDPASQKSDLEITSSGELIRYEWSQSSGGSLTVVPSNDFLIERVTPPSSSKAAEKPFLMPATSSILDNNFFVHREVLVWRYLAADCKPEAGDLKCQKGPATFGAVVPQDQASVSVRVELVGRDNVSIRGANRELLRVNLTGENFAWSLWIDDHDQFKLIRVAIPADDTEVIRD